MTVGPGRFRIRRAGSPGAGPASAGLVVQAVLLMAMVTTIGVLVVAARVAGSRQSATAATLNNEARQAAEYGFSETVAEMNRDSKSYLWVVDSSAWNSVSEQDLKDCGVASTNAPSSNPIPGVVSNVELPQSPGLSYRIISYQAPGFLDSATPTSHLCRTGGIFGNLIGGSGEITIVGTLDRGSGSITTYTLKRTVSVKRAAPIFNNPITAIPTSRGSFSAADSRFPDFPTAPSGSFYDLTCQPQLNSTDVIECEATSNNAPKLTQNFKSATADSNAPGLGYFPFVDGAPWSPICNLNPIGNKVQCLVTSMTVKKNGVIDADMLVKPSNNSVEIFLSNDMTIESGSKLSGDKDNWSGFRIFGASSGTSCPPPSQTITISSFSNTATDPATVETNLQNAFLWLKTGELKLESTTPALTSTPGLVGSVCRNNLPGDAISSNLPNRKFFEGLGGAYDFNGVFGALSPGDRPGIRFFYRGFGFSEQSITTP
jgi:hypothetical protein